MSNAPGLIVDLFAGGGGASWGLEMALGRSVDVAVNHNPEAIAIHAANHPSTRHFVQNIHQVHPLEATGGRPVDVLWASPDCKHFSKAKGTKPKNRNIRELAWVVIPWIRYTRPKLVCVENVEEFLTWGPLDAAGQPIKALAGRTFERWARAIRREGYSLEWRLLKACDHGAPTIRRRLFIVARRDGRPVRWPEPTHGPGRDKPWRTAAECIDWSIPVPSIFDRRKPLVENTLKRIAEGLRRFVIETDRPFIVNPDKAAWVLQANTGVIGRPADWPLSTICQSGSHQQLAEATLTPFIQHVQHGGRGRAGVMSADEPLRTVTAYPKGGGMALVAATLVTNTTGHAPSSLTFPVPTLTTGNQQMLVAANLIHYYGAKPGERPRCAGLDEPFRTATTRAAQRSESERFRPAGGKTAGNRFGLMTAEFAPFIIGSGGPAYSGKPASLARPLGTLTTDNHKTLVTAYLSHFYNTMQDGRLELPMKTVTSLQTSSLQSQVIANSRLRLSGGRHSGLVAVFLSQYYGLSIGSVLWEPTRTATSENKAGLVAAFLTKYYGTALAEPLFRPMSTVTTKHRLGLTTAFLAKYQGQSKHHALTQPFGTLTTKERYGLVASFLTPFGISGSHSAALHELVHHIPLVWVEGEPYVIADIGLRMLTPRELARAQGFPDGYDFAPVMNGKPLTQKAQVAAIGNSVPPDFSYAVVKANLDALNHVEKTRPRRRRRSQPNLFPAERAAV